MPTLVPENLCAEDKHLADEDSFRLLYSYTRHYQAFDIAIEHSSTTASKNILNQGYVYGSGYHDGGCHCHIAKYIPYCPSKQRFPSVRRDGVTQSLDFHSGIYFLRRYKRSSSVDEGQSHILRLWSVLSDGFDSRESLLLTLERVCLVQTLTKIALERNR